jgi:CRP/FNR family cyclic AMP-dependent transcriptional regulator
MTEALPGPEPYDRCEMASTQADPIARAWATSFFSALPAGAQDALLDTAHEEETHPGQNVYRELAEPRFSYLALVVSGLLRSYVSSPGGRRIALRYYRPGEVVGLTSVLKHGAPSGVEVVRRGSVLRLDPVVMERLGQHDVAVAWAVAHELAGLLVEGAEMRIPNAFGSVRVRVSWHLLELMVEIDGRHVARVTQQELADSVGSVREVVARVLMAMQHDGILSREGPLVIVHDPEGLGMEARAIDA